MSKPVRQFVEVSVELAYKIVRQDLYDRYKLTKAEHSPIMDNAVMATTSRDYDQQVASTYNLLALEHKRIYDKRVTAE